MKNATKNYIIRLTFLGLVIIWMLAVFEFSNEPAKESDGTSSRVAKIIVEIIYKNKAISEKEELIKTLNGPVRKIAHFTLYALGGFLIANYINTYKIEDKKKLISSIAIGAIYACTDEFHQMFVEGRSGQITDVLLDTLGVATGVCFLLCIIKIARGYKSEDNKKISKHDIKNI